jgi:hypothetical protein
MSFRHLAHRFFKRGLTPELTGAGGPTGPQGTHIGHENGEAMANVGVRVERFVRLAREVEGGMSVRHVCALNLATVFHAYAPRFPFVCRDPVARVASTSLGCQP